MYFSITHSIAYTYDTAVFIEPLTVRLRPRSDGRQRLNSYNLSAHPTPAGRSVCNDLDGNTVDTLWFDGLHETLRLTATSQVETTASDPFDYIVTADGCLGLPVRYSEELRAGLEVYLRRTAASPELNAFTAEIAEAANGETIPFLTGLAKVIPERITKTNRADGPPMPPERTIKAGRGACRDTALLFMEACRAVGLAARFVSGYALGGNDDTQRELHAWAEVYLPGGGWRGFDPGLGMAVADGHVAVAASPTPEGAAPTSGSYRGTDIASRMDYEVSIRAATDPPPTHAARAASQQQQQS